MESEWQGKHVIELSETVPGVYLLRADLVTPFNRGGKQEKPLPVYITAITQRLTICWTA